MWGEVLFVDNDDDGAICNGRVCVKLENSRKAEGVINVVVEGKTYGVHVKELEAWSPSIKNALEGDQEEEEELEEEDESDVNESSEEEMEVCDDQEEEVVKDTWHEKDKKDKKEDDQGGENNVDDNEIDPNNEGKKDGEMDKEGKMKMNVDGVVEEITSDEDKQNDSLENQNLHRGNDGNGHHESRSTPSRPPGYDWKRASKSASEGRCGDSDAMGKEIRRASFSASSVVKGGNKSRSGGGKRAKNGEHNELSLINNMSRFIEIRCALGHDMTGCKEALSGIISGIGEKTVNK